MLSTQGGRIKICGVTLEVYMLLRCQWMNGSRTKLCMFLTIINYVYTILSLILHLCYTPSPALRSLLAVKSYLRANFLYVMR